ncbi:hypothetical protein [Streptantibioticus silvisoli]|uniref:Holin n=1 Tax=Streptantibioticus silvisoli TaxID=2705255 RepID=A0ABT6W4M7_9ACTN|nr:hypothetical protein [Streptantibioticus silvisoli]MDI5965707.1 hypothetical protein [Streptantibioticus silvisoli]
MKPALIFGREPAVILGAATALLQLLSAAVWHLTSGQQSAVNAVLAAVLAVVVAVMVHDGVVAAVSGLAQAGFALLLGFGFHVAPDLETGAMALIAAVGAAWLRTQVAAPVAADQLRPAPTPTTTQGA